MSAKHSLHLLSLAKKLVAIRASGVVNKQVEYKKTVFYELKSMGGVYFKLLQVLSTTSQFLEGWAGPAEMSVFNQVPVESLDVDSYIKRTDLLEFYERQPFSTGSFAQVYKGRLKNGQDVAIKILRPSIANHLTEDIRYMKRLSKILAEFFPSSLFDYRQVINEFCDTCLLETDYLKEIENMKYFTKFYRGHPHVVIPKVYEELSGSDIIVQEFITGPAFADALTEHSSLESASQIVKRLTGSDLWTQMIIAGGEYMRMVMVADYVFGDPHPGNIKLLPGNKIAFIDFGIIAGKPTSQRAFYEWTKAYRDIVAGTGGIEALVKTTLRCFCSDIAMALKKCRTDGQKPVLDTLAEAVSEKFGNLGGSDSKANSLAGNGHFFRLFTEVLDSNNSLNITLDTANFQLLKAYGSYLGALTVLDECETRDKFGPAMLAAMDYALECADRQGVKNDLPFSSRFDQGESYELLLETLSSLAEGDLFLFQYICDRMMA